jgi:hypothetical protein
LRIRDNLIRMPGSADHYLCQSQKKSQKVGSKVLLKLFLVLAKPEYRYLLLDCSFNDSR